MAYEPGRVKISGTPSADDLARFTGADTVEGRSYAEVASDIEGFIDHGNLTGLGDDDHSQYAADIETTLKKYSIL